MKTAPPPRGLGQARSRIKRIKQIKQSSLKTKKVIAAAAAAKILKKRIRISHQSVRREFGGAPISIARTM